MLLGGVDEPYQVLQRFKNSCLIGLSMVLTADAQRERWHMCSDAAKSMYGLNAIYAAYNALERYGPPCEFNLDNLP